jgi:hypothetical protein
MQQLQIQKLLSLPNPMCRQNLHALWWPCGETTDLVRRSRSLYPLVVVAQAIAAMAKLVKGVSVLTRVVLAIRPVADLTAMSEQSVQTAARV